MSSVFRDSSLPLHSDIGSDRGRFYLNMPALDPVTNFLGLEVRGKPVAEAQAALRAAEPPLDKWPQAFVHANANCHLEQLIPHLGSAEVQAITSNFTDLWTKKKHHKRRVL